MFAHVLKKSHHIFFFFLHATLGDYSLRTLYGGVETDLFFQGNQERLVSADLGWLLSPSSLGFANSKNASLAHSLVS